MTTYATCLAYKADVSGSIPGQKDTCRTLDILSREPKLA